MAKSNKYYGNKNGLKHGMRNTPTYNSWCGLKKRCLNPSHPAYHRYGGRGITICKRWLTFENFYADMGDRPRGMTLDRKNNNKGYCKSNCRWATREEQANNRKNGRLITYKSRTQTIAQWAKELNINYTTIWARLNRGWKIKKSLTK